MSADNKKHELRSMLAGKNTAELEELLAIEATEFDAAGPNADYIAAILEVISERESNQNNDKEMTEKAWDDFQEYYIMKKQEEFETDKDEKTPNDHHRKTKCCHKSPKLSRIFRYVVIAAILLVLLCGTAFGWHFFRTIADWSDETFHFITGHERGNTEELDVFHSLRRAVETKTDVPAVPNWAPIGSEESGVPKENERA